MLISEMTLFSMLEKMVPASDSVDEILIPMDLTFEFW